MSYPINFYGYKLNKEDEIVMEKMGIFLKKISGKFVHVHPVDVVQFNDTVQLDKNGISFGNKIKMFSEGETKWKLPDIKKLHADGDEKLRKKAVDTLKIIGEDIKNCNEKPEIEQESYVEKDGIKFGKLQDIQITEEEAEHLKKIRELLGGGTIVIKKGDLILEVSL